MFWWGASSAFCCCYFSHTAMLSRDGVLSAAVLFFECERDRPAGDILRMLWWISTMYWGVFRGRGPRILLLVSFLFRAVYPAEIVPTCKESLFWCCVRVDVVASHARPRRPRAVVHWNRSFAPRESSLLLPCVYARVSSCYFVAAVSCVAEHYPKWPTMMHLNIFCDEVYISNGRRCGVFLMCWNAVYQPNKYMDSADQLRRYA